LAFAAALVPAAQAQQYRLESASLPVAITAQGKVDGVIEPSGVEPIGDGRRVLVAHDKASPLHVMDAATGELQGEPISSSKFPATSKFGPKWEGMARDADGNFYVISSFSGKTDEERSARGSLCRFRLKESDAPTIDDASVVRWEAARGLVGALKAAGLSEKAIGKRKIEGLALRDREGRRELIIGLREPADKVRTFVADVTGKPDGAELEFKPLFSFRADPREGVESQLTSLEHVPALGGFLVVTATEDADNAFHGNTLWFVADGSTGQARKIATFEVAMKAEGLAVLSADGADGRTSVRLLITYDNDPHATKIPSRVQTVTLIREGH
jgi:hypothetical protein